MERSSEETRPAEMSMVLVWAALLPGEEEGVGCGVKDSIIGVTDDGEVVKDNDGLDMGALSVVGNGEGMVLVGAMAFGGARVDSNMLDDCDSASVVDGVLGDVVAGAATSEGSIKGIKW